MGSQQENYSFYKIKEIRGGKGSLLNNIFSFFAQFFGVSIFRPRIYWLKEEPGDKEEYMTFFLQQNIW